MAPQLSSAAPLLALLVSTRAAVPELALDKSAELDPACYTDDDCHSPTPHCVSSTGGCFNPSECFCSAHNATFYGCEGVEPHTCSAAVDKCKWCNFNDGQWFCCNKTFGIDLPPWQFSCKNVTAEEPLVEEPIESTAPPIVNTTLGAVAGERRGDVTFYRSIPFAAPPTKDNRYKAPQPGIPWSGVRSALIPNRQCPQLLLLGDEDCLLLHVAVPDECTPTSPCAVLFWIYGGAFVLGSDEEFGYYDPVELARTQRVIVVASNYRLGSLGFLALKALANESPTGTVGNWGTLDQRAAMQWTRSNVGRFGGDTNAVTLFGESAGAMSVCWHLAAPGSANLFHRAIVESGTCDLPAFFMPKADAESYGLMRAKKAGCDAEKLGSDEALLKCLRALPAHALHQTDGNGTDHHHRLHAYLTSNGVDHHVASHLSRLASVPPFAPIMSWGPVVDGASDGLPELPLTALLNGRGNYVDLIVGNNNDEGSLFVLLYPFLVPGASLPPKVDDLRRMVMKIFGGDWANSTSTHAATIATSIEKFYPSNEYTSEFWRNAALIRDFVFACPSRRLARAIDLNGRKVYKYHFAPAYCRTPGLKDLTWVDFQLLHCYHSSELYAVWGHPFPGVPGARSFGPRMKEVSESLQAYWGAFARTGDPNGVDANTTRKRLLWPPYHEDDEQPAHRGGDGAEEFTLILSEDLEVEVGYLKGACDRLDGLCGKSDCFGP